MKTYNHGLNNTTEEFKDSKGNVVLKRTYNNGEAHDTYYVYNKLNLLAFVIPPMANGTVLGDHLEKWCYQYNYDAKKRLVEKKIPQKDWEYIVYDKSDRVVMTGPVYNPFGDGSKGWLITKYDVFGRGIYIGYYAAGTFTSATRNTLSQNNFTIESKMASNTTIDGITTRYTNAGFPTNFKLLSINYYDDYNYPNAPTGFSNIETQVVNTAVKGQITGTWTRILTTAASTAGNLSYNLYDNKDRVIRTYSQNHLGGYTQVDNQINFTGTTAKTVTYQKQNNSATVLTVTDIYSYDRRDRLTKQTRQIGTGSIETIVSNTYDQLGVLITKNVGGATGNLQKVDYKYNIRGWLTDINNAEMDYVDGENDLFQFKINYNRYALQNVNLFNGNISSVWVRTKVDNLFKGYVYWYDHLNRLTQAKNMYYHRPGGWLMGQYMDDSYGEAVTYDKNGNILTMNRTGELLDAQQALTIDNLTYVYNGNQLLSVTDSSSPTINDGFKDGNKVGDDFIYDTFGNITQDKNKGVTAISYNHLNLPYQVTFANGSNIKYAYDAGGTRLSKKVQPNGGALVTTDYVNGFQYTDNVLKFFPHPEGYVEFKNNQYLYTYQYKDHLGNVRLTYRDGYRNHATLENLKDGIIQVSEIIEKSDYYPFGLKQKGNDLPDYSVINKYKYAYGGKELNDELGLDLYDFGARNYDAAIGRWLNVDPKAEEMRRISPYAYSFNNPIFFLDPDGMKPLDWYIDWNSGRVLGQDGAKTNNFRVIKGTMWAKITNSGGSMSKEATAELHKESNIITVNNNKIHSDLNTINDDTINDQTAERQAIFMLERTEDSEGFPAAELTTTIGQLGKNGSADIPNVTGFNNDQMIVGQAHTHNLDQTGRTNLPGTSDADYDVSKSRNFNIYAIDSYQGKQQGGNAIHMTNSNTENGINVGTTNDTSVIGNQVLDDFINSNKQ
ncbi:RHS repeat domain-containing protein [Paenimyroides baculatum]|uniref:RHS repeat-associated core domain-containing protein n=1 Tax=Paenimyroides baculatum TaxID=2608000 RepID=A0A5M6C8Y0_9FLAO|nr:RHS repeat-associated core domain-containing protein [Paenimyroides baculatum]KAA5531607.1 RHS repeat-associated core domain-containing protein [Paenimyroides baculatum]